VENYVHVYAKTEDELDEKVEEFLQQGCRKKGDVRKLSSGDFVQSLMRRGYVESMIHNSKGFNK